MQNVIQSCFDCFKCQKEGQFFFLAVMTKTFITFESSNEYIALLLEDSE